jgi:peptide deformylase
MLLKIERPSVIRMRYVQPNGQTVTKDFAGMTARVAQHEADHLKGKPFTDGLTKLDLNIAKRKANKRLGRKYYYI